MASPVPQDSPPSPPVHVYFSSSVPSAVTPESLNSIFPDLDFWTTEKRALTPKSAKVTSSHHNRKVVAFVKRQRQDQREDQMNAVCENLFKAVREVQEELREFKQEQRIYAPHGLNRYLAVVQVLSSLLNYINHLFSTALQAKDWKAFVGSAKPFATEDQVSYFKAWYFYHKELHVDACVSAEAYWAHTLGFHGRQGRKITSRLTKIGTMEAKELAEEISAVMAEAEDKFISIVSSSTGKTISRERLRSILGLYISMIRLDRNHGSHLLEWLFAFQKDTPPSVLPKPFSSVGKDFTINRDLVGKAEAILEDIISNQEKLEELNCIKDVIVWYAEWLLLQCKKSWKQGLTYLPEHACYKDGKNTFWYQAEDQWYMWDGVQWSPSGMEPGGSVI